MGESSSVERVCSLVYRLAKFLAWNKRLSSAEEMGDQGGGLLDGLLVAAEAGEPVQGGVFAEPGELALGVVAMALLGGCDGLVAGNFAA
jgi:hypothetical protein